MNLNPANWSENRKFFAIFAVVVVTGISNTHMLLRGWYNPGVTPIRTLFELVGEDVANPGYPAGAILYGLLGGLLILLFIDTYKKFQAFVITVASAIPIAVVLVRGISLPAGSMLAISALLGVISFIISFVLGGGLKLFRSTDSENILRFDRANTGITLFIALILIVGFIDAYVNYVVLIENPERSVAITDLFYDTSLVNILRDIIAIPIFISSLYLFIGYEDDSSFAILGPSEVGKSNSIVVFEYLLDTADNLVGLRESVNHILGKSIKSEILDQNFPAEYSYTKLLEGQWIPSTKVTSELYMQVKYGVLFKRILHIRSVDFTGEKFKYLYQDGYSPSTTDLTSTGTDNESSGTDDDETEEGGDDDSSEKTKAAIIEDIKPVYDICDKSDTILLLFNLESYKNKQSTGREEIELGFGDLASGSVTEEDDEDDKDIKNINYDVYKDIINNNADSTIYIIGTKADVYIDDFKADTGLHPHTHPDKFRQYIDRKVKTDHKVTGLFNNHNVKRHIYPVYIGNESNPDRPKNNFGGNTQLELFGYEWLLREVNK